VHFCQALPRQEDGRPGRLSQEEVAEIVKKQDKARSKPFGWEVTVEFHPSTRKPAETFHWRGGTERAARKKGILKPHAIRIVLVTPVSEEAWIQTYGQGRM
jgi:hypothetical protein